MKTPRHYDVPKKHTGGNLHAVEGDSISQSLGKIITQGNTRDAVHIAVASVTAIKQLFPGEHIGVSAEGVAGPSEHPIGIVDPFLTAPVKASEQFWMFLYPNTITSLRHEWTHPAFVVAAVKSTSELWIEAFAAELDQTYSRLMNIAQLFVEQGDYTYDNEEIYKDVDSSKWPMFWQHFQIVTGTIVSDLSAVPFTCSC